ncbi:hypothetical protein PsYK624_161020 [Phanerochaete sordida]|uniref:Uncharacterized protein n=1 Tax=Phanerochaete sordida TaxID=48140 RepID=A0A9P3GV53_9APHY|nr:hypothetical protein PsYK624_161020 [Phanerochaete sordida]
MNRSLVSIRKPHRCTPRQNIPPGCLRIRSAEDSAGAKTDMHLGITTPHRGARHRPSFDGRLQPIKGLASASC